MRVLGVAEGTCAVEHGASVPECGALGARGAGLAFTVVIRETPQRRLEVSRGLLLDLVCERVDLESVQPGDVNVTFISMIKTNKAHT